MAYEKPQVIAQNKFSGSFAASCPAKSHWKGTDLCRRCECEPA